MAIGDGAQVGVQSYVALGKESTYGTYASATTAIEAISCTFRTDIESEKLETFGPNRGYTKRVQKNKMVGGTLEKYAHPEDLLILISALGGGFSFTSATSAGIFSMSSGNFDTAPSSLSFNVRKGDTHVWRYMGGRVNALTVSANVGEVVKLSAEYIFKDSTQLSDNIAGILSISSYAPFVYDEGVFRYNTTETTAATSTSEERIQGFELTINNNLEEGRELGSDILRVLPPKRRNVEFKINQRFDTSTSYARFIQATQGAVELKFSGSAISSEHNNEMTIRMPKVFLNSPDPEIGGADELLSSEIVYDVLVDSPNTTTGRDIGITIKNQYTATI